jgi:SAM-dependent methyltransferase
MGEFTDQTIFARLTDEERLGLFHDYGERLKVREWLKAGITWRVGDATEPQLIDRLGPQDMVFANNFLCHMYPRDAEKCLRNVVRLVKPGGYLFVSGIDLNVRTKVARDLMLEPVPGFVDEIHNADPSLLKGWPFNYWGLEPMDKRKPDWKIRYSSVFRVPGGASAVLSSGKRKPVPASAV